MRGSGDLHMIIGTIVLIFCVYYYASFFRGNKLLIESFEGKIGVDTVDYGSSADSTISASGSSQFSKCGMQSLKLQYDLKPSGYVYCATGYDLHHVTDSSSWNAGTSGWIVDPDQIQWDDFNALSIYLRGQKSSRVAIDVKDAGGELWRSMVQVGSSGWKKFLIPFDEFSVRTDWQPDAAVKDRVMNFPITSLQIEPKDHGRNTLYADCVTLVGQLFFYAQKK